MQQSPNADELKHAHENSEPEINVFRSARREQRKRNTPLAEQDYQSALACQHEIGNAAVEDQHRESHRQSGKFHDHQAMLWSSRAAPNRAKGLEMRDITPSSPYKRTRLQLLQSK